MHGILGDLEIAMELQHTEAIKRAVEAGLGIGCLSIISLEDAFRRGIEPDRHAAGLERLADHLIGRGLAL